MAKKPRTSLGSPGKAVTAPRAARLCRLLLLLGRGPQTREVLARRLRLDLRGFYRDLEVLRAAGVAVSLEGRRYRLLGSADDAIARLPFPDPRLTLGEARQLARGRTNAHRKLKQLVEQILG